jgi:two-component system NtrC family sensor kinase
VRIALDEQDYKGVQTAMEYVKGDPGLKFISLVQYDTIWNEAHDNYSIKETTFETYPDSAAAQVSKAFADSVVVKKAGFNTSLMAGVIVLGFTTRQIEETKSTIRETSLFVSGCIFFVGIFIGWWLSRKISLPVIELRNAAKKVGEGDLTRTVKTFSRDEIGELAIAFNKMVHDLFTAREELKEINSTLSATNTTLNNTLNDLKATQTQLIQSEKMASLGMLTAGIAHEIQNPLNFVNNFSEINMELIDELQHELNAGNTGEALAIATTMKQNELKIIHHGNRADAIVKGMLQHSRTTTGQKEPADINALADEYLRISYHNLRVKNKTSHITLQTHFDPRIGKINIIPQDIGRVLLNLLNNAFYAVSEKVKLSANGYQPTAKVTTRKLNETIEIRVEDNGNGIPHKVLDKIFHPFFTTKPAGEGTGLGLSLSYDIIKAHGGNLSVETKEGEGATFIVHLPC